MLALAFPNEITKRPALLAIFKAYSEAMIRDYLRRHLNPADERDVST
jgi:hypothetical protein